MSISAIWLFLKSGAGKILAGVLATGAGKILAGVLAIGAFLLRMKWLAMQRDKANRAADVAKSEAAVERATTKINKDVQQKRAAAAKEQQAKVERDKAEAEAEGKRRDIGGGW